MEIFIPECNIAENTHIPSAYLGDTVLSVALFAAAIGSPNFIVAHVKPLLEIMELDTRKLNQSHILINPWDLSISYTGIIEDRRYQRLGNVSVFDQLMLQTDLFSAMVIRTLQYAPKKSLDNEQRRNEFLEFFVSRFINVGAPFLKTVAPSVSSNDKLSEILPNSTNLLCLMMQNKVLDLYE